MTENETKAELLKKSLQIVDELAELDVDDIDELIDLIERSEKLKKDRLWRLK